MGKAAEPATSAQERARAVRIPRARQTAIFKALADPHRLDLLRRIARARCPLACADARAALAISAATLSHHVKELESAGLVDVRREGKFAYLTLRTGALAGIAEVLAGLETDACDRS
ncbi:MAG TPA: metalloregulator ArsR/SmtB family transcription factor [Terracidiphilus sp.]|nr:metalloregulator ArsR/SmtB family transcription factor [Terracidiphilus sp.]